MPRYFFNTAANGHSTVDAFGLDLKDEAAAREIADRIAVRMADHPRSLSEPCVYVTTEGGHLAFKVPLVRNSATAEFVGT